MPKHTPAERVKNAKKKISGLIRKGTPFNMQAVSNSTVQQAANSGDPLVSQQAKAEIKRRSRLGKF